MKKILVCSILILMISLTINSYEANGKEEVMAKATARHILVDTEEKGEDLKKQIEGGADFAELAKAHSKCPSGQRGGDLGEFSPGQMGREVDEGGFTEEVGKVHGPVKTQFGYHLIEITKRDE